MKRFLGALAVLLIALYPAGCSRFLPDCRRPEVFCAGLVTNTAGLDDHGLNASSWAGINHAALENLVQKAVVIESVDTRDYSKNIATFAEAGYDVIVTSGAGLKDETLAAARAHETLRFVGVDQEPEASPLPNFATVTFPQDQGGFLAGALAAQLTRTSVIGAACETSGLASMWLTCEGFRAGARYIKPDIKVFVEYRKGSSPSDLFLNEDWGRQSAQGMIHDGADVIFGAGGRIGQGALSAAAEARIWSIGSEQDQYYAIREARPYLLTSVLPDASEAVYQLIRLIRNGEPTHDVQGYMELAPYHDMERFVPESAQKALSELGQALRNGSVLTNVAPEAP